MRTAVCLVALTLGCVAAICQTPDCSKAAERLHSEPLSEKAWGAYLAATCHLPGLAPEIAAEVDGEHGTSWNSAPFWVGHALLDALIQLRQPLDSAVLASF